jgi:hypothetical protein
MPGKFRLVAPTTQNRWKTNADPRYRRLMNILLPRMINFLILTIADLGKSCGRSYAEPLRNHHHIG